MDMPADRKEKLAAHYCALPAMERSALRQKLRTLGISQSDLRIHRFKEEGASTPLSPAQERLWFLWRLDPESPAYNIAGKVRLIGELDWQSLQIATGRLIERQESLRTLFREVDGVPFQMIEAEPSVSWQLLDIGDLAEPQRLTRLDQILAEAAQAPFDLEHGVPLRLTAIRLGPEDHVLHFAMHHIISDAWSMPILMNEFAILYNAVRDGQDAALPGLHVRYRDYALWQCEWLDRDELEQQLSYWRERLGKEHPVLQLPLDGKRMSSVSDTAGQIGVTIPSDLSALLRHVARRGGTTPFVVLLSGLQLLLYRYSGQSDIRIGIPVAGRDRMETQELIGFFVNTLVLRADVSGAMTLSFLLEQTRLRVLEAQRNQDVPFAQLVEELQPARSLSTTPLFQVMFNMHQKGRERISVDGATSAPQGQDSVSAQFDIVVDAIDRGETFDILVSYKTELFKAETIGRLAGHYLDVLTQFADTFGEPKHVARIELSQRTPNPAPADYAFVAVTDRIAQQAVHHPETEAVVCEGIRLSYGELEAWANRIARRLQSLGVRPDERVGLAVERSTGLVAALLGIIKAGAAYVPLDPSYPQDRLAHMIEDSAITRVVTDVDTAEALAGLLTGLDTVMVDAVEDESPEPLTATAPLLTSIHPDQLAYVIYTSGSTGLPKGVGISHRALSLHIDDFLGSFAISAEDTMLQSSTINFDVAAHECLPALIMGGRVVMRGPALWDLDTLTRKLSQEKVTFSRIPTAYWQQWLRNLPTGLQALRQITVGGEGLPGDALAAWQKGPLAHIALDNLYGPTETTIAALSRRTGVDDAAHAIAPIGVPYPSRSAYVMDGDGNEMPAGGLGELCIGGETLARGYLGRPGLTAEKFVPDPDRPGGRLYRTGDLCRQRVDGTVDFLGRIDSQIKLRGFRIELGEIEAALRKAQGVADAAAEVRGEGEGRHIVGYVTGTTVDTAIDTTSVKASLEASLPSHMVPSAIMVLDALPLMPNGKLDRRALPDPDLASRASYAAPRTETEAALCAIWQEVLGLERVGIDDNFFEIGGDSLLLLRAWARMTAVCGRKVPLAAFLARPTIEGFGAGRSTTDHIRRLNEAPAHAPPVFCIHPGFGLSNEYRVLAAAAGEDFAVFGVESPVHSDPTWTTSSLQELARHYLATIRKVQPQGPYRLVGWSLGGWVALEIAKLIEASSDGELAFVGLVDTEPCRDFRPFAKTQEQWRETVAEELENLGIPDVAGLSENMLSIAVLHQALLLDYALEPASLGVRTHVWWAEATTSFYRRRGQPDFLDWTDLLPSGTVPSMIDGSAHGDIIKNPRFVHELRASIIETL